MSGRIIYLGGNGHAAMRLAGARAALASLPPPLRFDLIDIPYPGFENRPRSEAFEEFLASVSHSVQDSIRSGDRNFVYATGIGGLLALCLRARGELPTELILQGAVLWGLERRWMPRLMRWRIVRACFRSLFGFEPFRRRFVRKQFERPLTVAEQSAFFDGYSTCSAATDLFHWIGPNLLRRLESEFESRPELLRNIEAWWGGKDHVVDLSELEATEQALEVRIPVRRFPDWGHYPMIDVPETWIRTLADALETAEPVPRSVDPETRQSPSGG